MTAAVGARNLFKVDAGVVHALLQARYYDGSKGEFLSEDPVFLGDPKQQVLTDPQSLNSYSYANDNPITRSDPSGRAGALALAPLATPVEILATITSPAWAFPAAVAGGLALTGYSIYSLSEFYSGEPPNFQTSM